MDGTQIKGKEQLLLRQLSQGASAAFWNLWEQHRDYLYNCCLMWMGGNREDAEDALSSACIRAWNSLPVYVQRMTNFKSWLMHLTHNVCMDKHRENKYHITYVPSIKDFAETDKRVLTFIQEDPEIILLRHEMYEYIHHAIDVLPSRLYETSILYLCQEMSYQEITKRLGISIENVRKRIQQARVILQKQLKGYLFVGDIPACANYRYDKPSILDWELFTTPVELNKGEKEEIKPWLAVLHSVQVILTSGVERHFYLTLDNKPVRQHQKVESLHTYVNMHPKGWKKQLELADMIYTMGNWEEAIKTYKQVLEKNPWLVELWLRLGDLLQKMDRNQEAITTYKQTLKFTCNESTKCHINGWIKVCQRHYKEACGAFKKAAYLEPKNAAHWHALGQNHLHVEHPFEALLAFDETLRINPDDHIALTYSYDALCVMGYLKEAYRRLLRAVEIDPDNVLALKRLADIRSGMGLVQGQEGKITRHLIQHALKLTPNNPDAWESLARYHFFRWERDKSITILKTFINEHPSCAQSWYHYALLLFSSGMYNTAAEAILKAYSLNPDDSRVYRVACVILPSMSHKNELLPLIEEMLQRFPEQWSIWISAGRALVEGEKDWEGGCATSSRGIELQPHLAEAWFQHGFVLSLTEKHREAIASLEEGWKWLPEDDGYEKAARASVCLGDSYKTLGEKAMARMWYKKAIHNALKLTPLQPFIASFLRGKALLALENMHLYKKQIKIT